MGIQIAGFTVGNIAEVESSTTLAGVTVPAPKALRVVQYNMQGQPVPATWDSNSQADREIFGAAVVAHRAGAIVADWTQPLGVNGVSATVSGGGSTSQANGLLQIISGASVTAAAQVQSFQKTRYQPGREIYCHFTAFFTTPTNAATSQRAGVYDATNGFWVGYEGTSFGISKKNLGVTVTTPQASFSVDTLTGAAGSQYTLNGTPVALNPTFLNIYRIRYGWLGSAPVIFQIKSPDGNWVTFHVISNVNNAQAPSVSNPALPITMEVNKTSADATSLIIGTSSWDAGVAGSNSVVNQAAIAPSNSIAGAPSMYLDAGTIARMARCDEYGTQMTTSAIQLWHDAFEGSTVNTFWTSSTTTMTIAQATGVLTLNNSGITTLNTDAIITSQRQFPKYPRQPLYARFRGNVSANVAANHTLVELGFGTATGVTAAVTNGAFFRWTAAGNLVGVVSNGATETTTATLIAQGTAAFSTTSYYYYDIVIDDDFVRFYVCDSNGVPLVDATLSTGLTTPYIFTASHIPTFARVYVDGTGGGTVVKLALAAHSVQILDGLLGASINDQLAYSMRSALINPTTYAQTTSSMTAAPATLTPANASAGYTTLGGEYAFATVVGFETGASIFGFQIPTPYTFMLTSIVLPPPIVATTIATTGIPYIEWLISVNSTTNLLSTGGGLRMPLGINHTAASAAAAQGSQWTSNGQDAWYPKTPIACLPNTFLHIGFKILGATVAGTPGLHRGTVMVDGYFI